MLSVDRKSGKYRARIIRANFIYLKTESLTGEGCSIEQTESGYEARYPKEAYAEQIKSRGEDSPRYFSMNMARVYTDEHSGADGCGYNPCSRSHAVSSSSLARDSTSLPADLPSRFSAVICPSSIKRIRSLLEATFMS